jgi:hypothetical protein
MTRSDVFKTAPIPAAAQLAARGHGGRGTVSPVAALGHREAAMRIRAARQEATPERLTFGNFERLHRALRPPADEPWRTIPWRTSILEACREGARAAKRVFLQCRAGHPLGCV